MQGNAVARRFARAPGTRAAAPPVSAVPLPRTQLLAWPRQFLGGAIGAAVSVAIVLTLGVVALSPLGNQAAEVGVAAAFTCAVLSASLYGLLSRCLMPAGSPSSATALIVATLVSRIVTAAPADASVSTVSQVVMALAAAVTLMGLMQLLMAAFDLGRLARVVPQPVLAGFMNGIALLILLAQLPALLALSQDQWQRQGWQALPSASVGALLLGLGTAAVVWLLAWRTPRAPGALLALLAGVAVYHGIQALSPSAALGPTLGNVRAAPTLPGLLTLFNDGAPALAVIVQHGPAIVLTAALLAVIGTLESMLNLRATDQQHDTRHDSRRVVWAMGLANLVGGPLGALPMVQVRARAAAMLQAGGRGRAAALGAAAASAAMITVGAGWIAELPLAVLAGVMLTIGVSLVDRWSGPLWRRLHQGPRRRMVRNSLAIMAFVCLLTVWRGPALGVAVGLVLSTVAFVHGMNRTLVRSRRDGVAAPSRRFYPVALAPALQSVRRRIQVLELEGALFFGTAERVAEEADGLDADCRFLVLDLRRVSAIDDSAILVLSQLQIRLNRQGTALLLAGVGAASAQREQLQAFMGDDAAGDGTGQGTAWFFDADHAVEFAELHLLAEVRAPDDAHSGALDNTIPLSQNSLMQGLSAEQQAVVTSLLQTRQLAAGQRLFSAGDAADGLYLLSQGSVSVRSPTGQRYVSFSPATMLGELAMLDGQGRSADAVADSDCVLHLLTRDALATLAETDPLLCALLYRNIALHLAGRLRVASEAWNGAAA